MTLARLLGIESERESWGFHHLPAFQGKFNQWIGLRTYVFTHRMPSCIIEKERTRERKKGTFGVCLLISLLLHHLDFCFIGFFGFLLTWRYIISYFYLVYGWFTHR